ncbi:hypothetical protein [Cysteiniphilum sp. 6C5]
MTVIIKWLHFSLTLAYNIIFDCLAQRQTTFVNNQNNTTLLGKGWVENE